MRHRILAGVSGNHEARSRKGDYQDPMEIIMAMLGLKHLYRVGTAFLKIDLWGDSRKRPTGSRTRPRYVVALNHGSGGGGGAGTALNRMIPLAISWGVDLLISGHTHKPALAPAMRLEPDLGKGVMVPRPVRALVATSWLTYGGYA